MNLQPTLENDCILIRPLQAADFEAAFAAASDPKIWEQHFFPTRYQLDVFKPMFTESLESQGQLVFVDKKNNKIFGWSRFYDLDLDLSEVAIGYTFMARDYWGGHYNKQVKDLMVNYALQFIKRVEFHVDENNKRSQKAMEKIGARLLPDRLEKTKPDGGKRYLFVYEMKK